ncbi:MAG: thiamine biosynthesis protein ApbE [Flavobacteriaceae bacterium]|nr:MAG: thiamine biosynthesis protein ApbE [Flavobacteriaceae bacterium]
MKKLLFFIAIVSLFSCADNSKPKGIQTYSLQGNAIGTTYSIKFLSTKQLKAEKAIDSLIKAVNKSTSQYIPTSDISKINAGDSTLTIDHYFEDVFLTSKRIFEETNGYFDPTVGILVNTWGFGPEKTIAIPDSTTIKELLKYVGFKKVKLIAGHIIKNHPSIKFDFNAVGKGYLVDVISNYFETKNIENYMVEIGGEIRARGHNDKNTPWTIAIENPNFDGSRSIAITIQLNNESIASSGNYRKFKLDKNGHRYVHTINPKTGFATASNLLSASVFGAVNCADADAYATAFMAMGLEKTKAFLPKHPELKVFLIFNNKKGALETFQNFKPRKE